MMKIKKNQAHENIGMSVGGPINNNVFIFYFYKRVFDLIFKYAHSIYIMKSLFTL